MLTVHQRRPMTIIFKLEKEKCVGHYGPVLKQNKEVGAANEQQFKVLHPSEFSRCPIGHRKKQKDNIRVGMEYLKKAQFDVYTYFKISLMM